MNEVKLVALGCMACFYHGLRDVCMTEMHVNTAHINQTAYLDFVVTH